MTPVVRLFAAAYHRAEVFGMIIVDRGDNVRAVVKRDMRPDLECLFYARMILSVAFAVKGAYRDPIVCESSGDVVLCAERI